MFLVVTQWKAYCHDVEENLSSCLCVGIVPKVPKNALLFDGSPF